MFGCIKFPTNKSLADFVDGRGVSAFCSNNLSIEWYVAVPREQSGGMMEDFFYRTKDVNTRHVREGNKANQVAWKLGASLNRPSIMGI